MLLPYTELIITAGGENVAPVPIEDCVKEELPVVANCMLIGDKKKFLAMLITLKVSSILYLSMEINYLWLLVGWLVGTLDTDLQTNEPISQTDLKSFFMLKSKTLVIHYCYKLFA